MTDAAPHVVVDLPAGWRAAAIPPPKISESAGAELVQFAAFTHETDAITIGCVATPVPGWVDDMRPAVEGRMVALAGASAALASGKPIDAKSDPALSGPSGSGGFVLRSVNDLEGPSIGSAKTFLGFDAARVHTCFATCTGGDVGACRNVIENAHLEGSAPPPRPGIALAGVTWAVHHPGPFATGAAVLVVVAGIFAIVSRRRPRTAMR